MSCRMSYPNNCRIYYVYPNPDGSCRPVQINCQEGPTGYTGYTGTAGEATNTGSTGYTGYTGLQGIDGMTGYTGPTGYTGLQGIQGVTGSQGPTGYTGPQGVAGTAGDQGATGATGYTGPTGYTGARGTTGYTGFTGFAGETGYTGYTGYTGERGTIGYTGYTGFQGETGYTGYTGERGTIGYTGYTGPQGASGPTGYTGERGVIGYTGYTGPQGATGYTGYTGDRGTIGYTGYTGYTGETGYTGPGVNASFMRGSRSSAQSIASAGTPIIFTQVDVSYAGDISLDTSTGIITLAPNRTYRLIGGVPNYTSANSSVRPAFAWYNRTTSTQIGSLAAAYSAADTATYGAFGGISEMILTTSTTTQVDYRAVSLSATVSVGGNPDFATTVGSFPWFEITVIAGNAPTSTSLSNSTIQTGITVSATTTAPTIGARSMDQINYRTISDKIRICYRFGWAAGTAGSGDYIFTLPTGITFKTTSGYNPTYTGVLWSSGVNPMAPYLIPITGGIVHPANWSSHGYVIPYSSTTFRIAFTNNNTNSFDMWKSTWYPFSVEGELNIEFEIWV
jgi:collagen type VII alpha